MVSSTMAGVDPSPWRPSPFPPAYKRQPSASSFLPTRRHPPLPLSRAAAPLLSCAVAVATPAATVPRRQTRRRRPLAVAAAPSRKSRFFSRLTRKTLVASKMALTLTRHGYGQVGFFLELRHLCLDLGYSNEVEYRGVKLPATGNDDAPRAEWEVTATLLSSHPNRSWMTASAGGDTFVEACQNAALLFIGMLGITYHNELQHTPYRYHPRRMDPNDYASFRGTLLEDDTTLRHLARMVEAYDTARVDFHKLVKRGLVENNLKILSLLQENLSLKKELDTLEEEMRQLKLAHGQATSPKPRRVCRSLKITARKSTTRPTLIRKALAEGRVLTPKAPGSDASSSGSSPSAADE